MKKGNYCPICGEHLTKNGIKAHFTHHWNNANSNILEGNNNSEGWINSGEHQKRKNRKAAMAAMKKFSSKKDFLEDDNERLLARVKNNRITRVNILREKTRKKHKKSEVDTILDNYNNDLNPSTCFMCGTVLFGSLEQINIHIDQCLQQQQSLYQQESEVQNLHDTSTLSKSQSFDEYTWAGQTRIRATSLHEGHLSDIASNSVGRSKPDEDTDVELNIEDDETEIYGQKQYGEQSILKVKQEKKKEEDERMIDNTLDTPIVHQDTTSPKKKNPIIRITLPTHLIKNRLKENKSSVNTSNSTNNNSSDSTTPKLTTIKAKEEKKSIERGGPERKDDKNLIIDALRAKIREMEKEQKEGNKCLICLEPFVNPVTSINCWHVFCEKCWLQTLGAKRLCPQCQIITSPGDLRRIYL